MLSQLFGGEGAGRLATQVDLHIRISFDQKGPGCGAADVNKARSSNGVPNVDGGRGEVLPEGRTNEEEVELIERSRAGAKLQDELQSPTLPRATRHSIHETVKLPV